MIPPRRPIQAAPAAPLQPSGTVRLQPSVGTQLTSNAFGYALGFQRGGRSFKHPWKPTLTGAGVRLARGLVMDMQSGIGIEPTINGVRISGEPGKRTPTLRLDPAVQNENGESWICLEVEPDAEGALTPETVRIVQSKYPTYVDRPAVGRQPLALVVWHKGRPAMCSAIAHFHLRYLRFTPPAGSGNVRHYFL